MKTLIRTRSLLVIGLSAVLLPACGEREMLGLSAPPDDARQPFFIENPQPDGDLGSTTLTASKSMTRKDGGEVTIGKYKVSIPKDALSMNATVTLTIVDEEFAWIRVSAGAATLTQPLIVKMTSLDHTDGRMLPVLMWYGSIDGAWAPLTSSRDQWELSATRITFGDFRVGSTDSGAGVQWIRWLEGPGYETEWIVARDGGDVEYGRYKLLIPKYALARDTYITVRDPGSGYLECYLEPHGLQFLAGVNLETDLNGLDGGYNDWTTWWLNENTDGWEDQGGVYVSGKIKCTLWHFSTYRPGRAGW